jgi:hypothetical protein
MIRVPWPLLVALLLLTGLVGWQSRATRGEVARLRAEVGRLESVAADLGRRLDAAPPPGARTITRAMDGDTVELNGGQRIRLAGIDTPETWHRVDGEWQRLPDPDPRGVAAAAWLESLVGRQVEVAPVATDRYGRTVARLRLLPAGPDLSAHIEAMGWSGRGIATGTPATDPTTDPIGMKYPKTPQPHPEPHTSAAATTTDN